MTCRLKRRKALASKNEEGGDKYIGTGCLPHFFLGGKDMKLMEAIRRIDELKHNTYTTGEKIMWLSELDGNVKKTVYDTHIPNEGEDIPVFSGYTEKDVEDTEGPVLLIPAPWESVYVLWLEAQIDYYNGEYDRYNNAVASANAVLQSFESTYHRTHRTPSTAFNQGGMQV